MVRSIVEEKSRQSRSQKDRLARYHWVQGWRHRSPQGPTETRTGSPELKDGEEAPSCSTEFMVRGTCVREEYGSGELQDLQKYGNNVGGEQGWMEEVPTFSSGERRVKKDDETSQKAGHGVRGLLVGAHQVASLGRVLAFCPQLSTYPCVSNL